LAKQNSQKTLAYRNAQHSARMLTQERIHRSGSELLLAKTTTNPAAKLVTAATGPAESFLPVATA